MTGWPAVALGLGTAGLLVALALLGLRLLDHRLLVDEIRALLAERPARGTGPQFVSERWLRAHTYTDGKRS